MFEKHLIISGDEVCCLKYNIKTGVITIGGMLKSKRLINKIVSISTLQTDEFLLKGKCIYTAEAPSEYFDKLLNMLIKKEFVIEQVKSHGRHMR